MKRRRKEITRNSHCTGGNVLGSLGASRLSATKTVNSLPFNAFFY